MTIVLGILAGLAGGLAWLLGLTIFFGPAQRILADPDRQSEKFLRVFSEIEPLPRTLDITVLVAGLLLIGTIHGLVYAFLSGKLPGGVIRRGIVFSLIRLGAHRAVVRVLPAVERNARTDATGSARDRGCWCRCWLALRLRPYTPRWGTS